MVDFEQKASLVVSLPPEPCYLPLITRPLLGEHALVGVSPFNSYYSEERLEKIFHWALCNFKTVHAFLPDEVSVYNLQAVGYPYETARRKARKQDCAMRNKIMKAFQRLGFSPSAAHHKILPLSLLRTRSQYQTVYQQCIELFERDPAFRADCFEAAHEVLVKKTKGPLAIAPLRLAVDYILAELPVWFNTPSLTGVSASAMIYHNLSPAWKNLCYNYGALAPTQTIYIQIIRGEQ